MISIFSLYTWDVFEKVESGLIGYYSGNVDVIPSQNLLIIAKT